MAYTLQIRSRTWLPGQGFDSSGNAVQGKQMLTGTITISSYTTGGESVEPKDLGLSTVDHATWQVVNANDATVPVATTPFTATYNGTGNLLFINTNASTQAEATSTQTAVVNFTVIGDSAHNAELL